MPGRRRTEAPALSDGEITALVVRRSQDERVAVHLDGRRVFDLSAIVADRAGLRAGDVLTAEHQQELIDQDAPYRARERALRLLGLRDRARREVEGRLRQAGFEVQVVADTVEWLEGLGYLNDRRFACAYAAEKQRGGWGPRRIRAELAAKGVERSVVDETLAQLEESTPARAPHEEGDPETGMSAVEQTVRKRFAAQFASDPAVAERKMAGFLARRGYDWQTINQLVRQMRSEAAEDPEYPSIP